MVRQLLLLRLFLCFPFVIILGFNRTDEASIPRRRQPPPGYYAIHPDNYFLSGLLPWKDYQWLTRNIPFLDFPDDKDILTAYYYRWKMYRKHIRFVVEKNLFVVTEFLPVVPWAGQYNTIPAAAGHHIMEGRWIHDQRILNDYIAFWFSNDGGDVGSYTNWIGHAAWHRYLLNGNRTFIASLQNDLIKTFREIYVPKYLKEILWNGTQPLSCWWQNDGWDAMEVSISGSGCRPTIASAMYGEADTILKVSELNADDNNAALTEEFVQWREMSRSLVLDYHWNQEIQSFAVIPTVFENNKEGSKRKKRLMPMHYAKECDISVVRVPNRTAPVRELLAFVPWYFESLIPSNGSAKYIPMWKELFDFNGFSGKWGLRTAELRHPCYNYSYDHGDCWNGPSWPYETARVLTGFANFLNRGSFVAEIDVDNIENYFHIFRQYAQQHTKTFAINDTAIPEGSGHIFENLHADLGYWNNRQRMYDRNDTNRNMGDDYNHSTFIDLVLSGLLGIRPQEDGSVHVFPLVPPWVTSFAADHVKVLGSILTMIWDENGTVYDDRFDQGLTVLLDGRKVAHSSKIELLVIHPTNFTSKEEMIIRQVS